jgi:hypothetical protein
VRKTALLICTALLGGVVLLAVPARAQAGPADPVRQLVAELSRLWEQVRAVLLVPPPAPPAPAAPVVKAAPAPKANSPKKPTATTPVPAPSFDAELLARLGASPVRNIVDTYVPTPGTTMAPDLPAAAPPPTPAAPISP